MSTKPSISAMTNGITSLGKETILRRAVHIISLPGLVIEAEADEDRESGRIKPRVKVKPEKTKQGKTPML